MKNKILIISSEFPPGPGGIGNHAFNISSQLFKRGYQIIVNTKSDYVNENQEIMFDLNAHIKFLDLNEKIDSSHHGFIVLKLLEVQL